MKLVYEQAGAEKDDQVPESVLLVAFSPEGFHFGWQSLKQMQEVPLLSIVPSCLLEYMSTVPTLVNA